MFIFKIESELKTIEYFNLNKTIICLTFLSLSFGQILSQNIKITYDYSSVEKLIDLFDDKRINDDRIQEYLKLPGTQAYLRKLTSFFPDVTENSYENSLKSALKGSFFVKDPYMFKRLVALLPTVKKLLKEVIKNESILVDNTVLKLKEYSPENVKIKAKVYLTMGMIGGGWTFDDNPNNFYVDFSSMEGDFLGLSYLCSHELYHLIQYRFMNPIKKSNKVLYLLDQILREGSATYISDFSKIEKSDGAYVAFCKKEYKQNFNRIETNFALFESILFSAEHQKSSNLNELYNIGFSGMYQSPLYYVGYHIIKLIEKYLGKKELKKLFSQEPNKLFLTYIELCNMHADSDNEFIVLNQSTITILENLTYNIQD